MLCAIAPGAHAVLILSADATGTDNQGPSDSFWGFSLAGSGGIFVSQIVIDAQGGTDTDGVFDPYGSAPAVISGSTTGITAGDITFTPPAGGGPSLSTLTIDFAASSFGAGDIFRVTADTDFIGAGGVTDDGGDIGLAGVTITAFLEGGGSFTTAYSFVSDTQSTATLTLAAAVAEPTSLALFGLGLAGLGLRRRRQV